MLYSDSMSNPFTHSLIQITESFYSKQNPSISYVLLSKRLIMDKM